MEVGLPFNMIDLIMSGVTSVCSNVNWHGRRTDFFHPQRGIRQGDHIFPYLFVMCMDKLSHHISQKVEEGSWKGLRELVGMDQLFHTLCLRMTCFFLGKLMRFRCNVF